MVSAFGAWFSTVSALGCASNRRPIMRRCKGLWQTPPNLLSLPIMTYHRSHPFLVGSAAIILLLLLALAACAPGSLLPVPPAPVSPIGTATPVPGTATASPTPTPDRWQEIGLWTPYPHTTPLPPMATTSIDGLYVYTDTVHAVSRTPCRRCPPYPPLAGVWKLQLDRGVFRVIHPATGWRTLGSFAVDGDRVTFFNDPNCHLAVGVFGWQMAENSLTMQLVGDDCELGTRALLFTGGAWQNCQPPNHEAAVSGHWKTPPGC